jgi:hypothetical protein
MSSGPWATQRIGCFGRSTPRPRRRRWSTHDLDRRRGLPIATTWVGPSLAANLDGRTTNCADPQAQRVAVETHCYGHPRHPRPDFHQHRRQRVRRIRAARRLRRHRQAYRQAQRHPSHSANRHGRLPGEEANPWSRARLGATASLDRRPAGRLLQTWRPGASHGATRNRVGGGRNRR